jgi:hypothetical protein
VLDNRNPKHGGDLILLAARSDTNTRSDTNNKLNGNDFDSKDGDSTLDEEGLSRSKFASYNS